MHRYQFKLGLFFSLILVTLLLSNNVHASEIQLAEAKYSISGTVTGDYEKSIIIKVTGTASANVLTDAKGTYTVSGLKAGKYTVTPSKYGYEFIPANQEVTLFAENQTGINFKASALPTYSISGTILLSEADVPKRQNRKSHQPGAAVKASAMELGIGFSYIIAAPGSDNLKVLPSAIAAGAKPTRTATFDISYLTPGETDPWGYYMEALDWPTEAKTAFEYAAQIWAAELTSSVPIKIRAMWTADLPSSSLAGGASRDFMVNFPKAPMADIWYQIALANSLSGQDLAPGGNDIFVAVSSTRDWYYGTDANPSATQYDLVTVSLHELCHGLAYATTMDVSNNLGSWGSETDYCFIYDHFIENGSGKNLVTDFDNNSTALAAQLTGGDLFFNGTKANSANGGTPPGLYAPSTWVDGTSVKHLADSYSGTVNALMIHSIQKGQAIHNTGPVTRGILRDQGWSVSTTGSPLPDVAVSSGTRSDISDSNGNFEIIQVLDGTYTVTPSLNGYVFTPENREVTVNGGNITGCDFNAEPTTNVNATIGTTFTINRISEVDKKPSVYATYVSGGKTKKKTAKVENSKDFPTDQVECLWKAKGEPGDYTLMIKGKSGGENFEDEAGTVILKAPTIQSISPEGWVSDETVTVTGTYFGTKPKTWLTYTSNKGKTKKKSCKIVKTTVSFNSSTGASELDIIVPKLKGSESDITLVIDSGTGQGTYSTD